jgi:hypothetical protein
VVTPETTYVLMEHIHDNRRIHTDGRDFPGHMSDQPTYAGAAPRDKSVHCRLAISQLAPGHWGPAPRR